MQQVPKPQSLIPPKLNNPSRRSFLRAGVIGSALLASVSGVSVLTGCSSKPEPFALSMSDGTTYLFLNKEDIAMVAALIPVIVGDSWPQSESAQADARGATLERIDRYLSRMGAFNMKEIRQLFDLLHLRLARGLATGIWSDWEGATHRELDDFIASWRHSSISLFNNAHNALADIIGMAWYTNPDMAKDIGYNGPPDYVLQSLPQFKRV